MPSKTGNLCPDCRSPLTSLPDAAPWCPDCEWNLDDFPSDPRFSWFWQRIQSSDQKAGFRSDLQLALAAGPSSVGPGAFAFLVGLSAVLMLVMVAAMVLGVWLSVVGGPLWPLVCGLLLLGVAALIRPRYGRLGPMLKNSYRVEPGQAPAVHALIGRIAAALDAPRPDVLLLDFEWNASVTTVGLRQRRVLSLGVPLLLALQPQEVTALIAHELGHLKHDDSRRALLTGPSRTVFGRLSELIRPPQVSALELGPSRLLVGLLAWQLTGGLVSWLLFAAHLGVNVVAARDNRTVELRADQASAQAAGTEDAMRMLDVLAMLPSLTTYVQHHVPKGEAAVYWRRMLQSVRERQAPNAADWRQLSIRTEASLFSSHPAPGRRHQRLAGRPPQLPAVVVHEVEAARIELELRPYAEALHRTMLRHVTD